MVGPGSFITGRYIVHITGDQAGTQTNLTPLQFTILSEKLAAANYENHFFGKGHMGWQTTDHLLVNRGFKRCEVPWRCQRAVNQPSLCMHHLETHHGRLGDRGDVTEFSHMGYLGGSESYKWGRHDSLDSPNPTTGAHDMCVTV